MRALASFLCVAVYMASVPTLSPPADAASLRVGAGKSTIQSALASLSATETNALTALSAKYHCDLGAASLVTTLKIVVARSHAASDTLTAACSAAQHGYKEDSNRRLEEADKSAATADQKGEDVYASGKNAAHTAFTALKDEHEMAVQDANDVFNEARSKEIGAAGVHQDKGTVRLEAAVLFEQESRLLDETVATVTRALYATRDSVISGANASRGAEVAMAEDDLDTSYGECRHAYDARMTLLKRDETIMKTKIKPLMSKLMSNKASTKRAHKRYCCMLHTSSPSKLCMAIFFVCKRIFFKKIRKNIHDIYSNTCACLRTY